MVGTVHLESWVGKDYEEQVVRTREGQLAEAARAIEAEVHSHNCAAGVLMGDLNWDDKKQKDPLRHVGESQSRLMPGPNLRFGNPSRNR